MGGSMKTQFEQMMDGLNNVEAFPAGEQEGFKAHAPHAAEVIAKACVNGQGPSCHLNLPLDPYEGEASKL